MTGDGFGMFFTLILSMIVYYMVADGCSNMSMYCLLVFGLISGFESLFGLLTLFSVLRLDSVRYNLEMELVFSLVMSQRRNAFCANTEVLGGRSSTSTLIKSRDSENVVYETQVSVHPFFDGRQGSLACKELTGSLARFFAFLPDFPTCSGHTWGQNTIFRRLVAFIASIFYKAWRYTTACRWKGKHKLLSASSEWWHKFCCGSEYARMLRNDKKVQG